MASFLKKLLGKPQAEYVPAAPAPAAGARQDNSEAANRDIKIALQLLHRLAGETGLQNAGSGKMKVSTTFSPEIAAQIMKIFPKAAQHELGLGAQLSKKQAGELHIMVDSEKFMTVAMNDAYKMPQTEKNDMTIALQVLSQLADEGGPKLKSGGIFQIGEPYPTETAAAIVQLIPQSAIRTLDLKTPVDPTGNAHITVNSAKFIAAGVEPTNAQPSHRGNAR